MKKVYTHKNTRFLFPALLAVLMLLGAKVGVGQATIVYWDFSDGDKRTEADLADPKDISVYTADQGTGTIDIVGGAVFTGWVVGEGGTGTSAPNSNKWDEGVGSKYWQISTSTEGFSEIRLGSKQQSSNTGPRDFKVQYSTDGTTWVDVPGGQVTVANNFTTGVLGDIELPADCENRPTLHLRWVMASNTSVNDETVGSAGTSRIDGIELTGSTQEPFLSADPGAISGLSTIEGRGPSSSDSFVLEGSNLEPDNATISINAPIYFEVSLNNIDFYGSVDVAAAGGALSQEVFVRLVGGLSEGSYAGDITVSGGAASGITVALSGQVREKVFLMYTFSGESAEPTQKPENATTSNFQISSGSISYGSSHAAEWSGSGVPYAQGSGWTAETIDDAKHLGFSVSAHSGYFIGLSRISFFYRRTGAGPQHIAIEVNGTEIERLENIVQDEVLFFDQALSLGNQSDVEVQIKGWNGGSGDFRINDVRLDGEITTAGLTTWSGAGNSDWHHADNWSDGVPDAYTDAVIPGDAPNYPTIDPNGSAASVNNLHLGNGASLLDNGKLTINGDFVMERVIDDGGFAWHFISAPVSGMAVVGSDFVPPPSWATPRTFDFYAFNEAAQSASEESAKPWVNVRMDGENASPAFVNFVPGKGYLVAYHGDYSVKTFGFSGQMNTGNIDIALGFSSDADGCNQGWNLLGNPYPSGIDWAALAHHELFENIYAYVYNPNKPGGAGYEIIGSAGPGVAGRVIAPNQGFFVKAASTADGQTFAFTDNIRVHGGTFLKGNDQQDFLTAGEHRDFLKDNDHRDFMKDNDPQDFLTLKFADGELYDHTTLRVQAGTSETKDSHDAHKLFSFSAEVPQLYSKTSDGVRVAINAVPEVNEESVFPLGLRVPETGTYTISLEETGGQFARMDIYLYDRETDAEVMLSQAGRYEFEAEASGDDLGEPRFRIGFKSFEDATTIQDPQAPMAWIYTFDNTLVIEFTEAAPHRQVGVYDLGGRTILQQPLENASVFRRALDLMPGVYVVRVSDRTGTQTERVFIQ